MSDLLRRFLQIHGAASASRTGWMSAIIPLSPRSRLTVDGSCPHAPDCTKDDDKVANMPEETVHHEVPHRAMITACAIGATVLQLLDQTIANVALPYMQGSFSSSFDEITWVLTSYITASAIMTAPVGWLAARYGSQAALCRLYPGLHRHLDALRRGPVTGPDRRVPHASGCSAPRWCRCPRRCCSISIRRSGALMSIWGIGVMWVRSWVRRSAAG